MPVDVWAIDGLSLSGLETRLAEAVTVMTDGTALGSRSGVRPGDPGLTVTLAGSAISCSPGVATIGYSGQGVYRAAFPTTVSPGNYTAAHATLNRIDLVYLRVWDTTVDASGLSKGDIVYLAGTPAASPVAPTPSGTQIWIPLATISVLSVSNGSTASVSTAVRPNTVAPGGILPTATAPSSPYTGQYYDNGTDLLRWNGTSWDTYQKANSVAWTSPSLGTGYTTGNGTTNGNANGPVRYRTYTDRGTPYMEWDGAMSRTSGAQITNVLSAALAANLRPVYRASFVQARSAVGISGVSNSTNVVHSVKVDFNTDGTVALVAQDAGSSEAAWISLRGIRYPLS
ncbi:hypothetical protein [Streptomyces bauhiniae]|uniref:Uncharacterized protein n=1 Tax=Streptomyces bauhiniae TaxID=2340725 RepID=A0A7K3QRJ9_9ACTN|nr:hypothetical protein [Streptomyces bauhiniae]NEB92455.1 hypothetical protein [Streptomyces bauhiniae]